MKDLAVRITAKWMTAEQAAKHLGCESVKAFEKIAAREGIPKHYLSARAPRYNRRELDEWLLERHGVFCRQFAQQVFELQGHAHRVLDLVRPLKAKGGTRLILHMELPNVNLGQTVGPLNSKFECILVDLAKFVSGSLPPAGS